MRRLGVLTALIASLAMPVAAAASTIFVVKGRGFGHGIGMSQYGAQGFAQHGWDYRRILAHYYRGTTVGSAATRTIRVLLSSGGSPVVSHVSRAGTRKLNPARAYRAHTRGGGVVLTGGGRTFRFGGPVRLGGPRGYTLLSGSAYRGKMELRPGVMAIDVLSLDNYVQGVVPGEMPASWLPEALKVQAVAARSYALATDAGGPLFDQYADTRSQAYHGMSAETPTTNAATRDTARQVVLYQGAVATTFYFSTSGGRTENVENVFYGAAPSPYLKSVKDPYDGGSPRHKWQIRLTRAQLGGRLGSLCAGSFKAIKVVKRGVSPRVVTADVVCSRGRARTNGAALRARLGLYDTWFTVTKASSAARRVRAASDVGVPLITPLVHPRTIYGTFSPRPREVSVSRFEAGRWRLVARGLTNRIGQYSVPVFDRGMYRVSGAGVNAEPVSVR